jgi:lipoteichoic acid synthase
MELGDYHTGASNRSGFLLSWRDWVYVLALLAPLILYNLSLKALRVASFPGTLGPGETLGLMRSDLLFNLGYALFWVGLFAFARGGVARRIVVLAFHFSAVVVALISTGAHGFYGTTGSSLDFGTVSFFLTSPEEVWPVVGSELTLSAAAAVTAALLYMLLGPWLLVCAFHRRLPDANRGMYAVPARRLSWPALLGTGLVVYALFSFSSVPGGLASGANESFARDAFLNVAVSEMEALANTPDVDAEAVRESLPDDTSLKPTAKTEKKNVVMIVLESTRARSVTPYNPEIQTTPYLDALSDESLFAEDAYAVVPHTTNALVASICGITPPDREKTDSLGDDIPANCLPKLLEEQGYETAFIQSPTENFERRPEVAEQMGFDEFYSEEDMDAEGFQRANYFGYEDDILLEPSRKWLEENGDDPFMVTYNTITPHHQYLAPDTYGTKEFSEDETVNDYQNSVRYMDFFVKNLIEQYKEMGLYEDTIFVIQGDHGEGFGEHGRFQHDNVVWNEGIKIPLMVLDPSRPAGRVETPVNELDILPTVADLLGYDVAGGEYPGYSLLDPPEDRTLYASCWYENKCLASVKGDSKYIYHYGSQSEEVYDLSEDPREQNNIVDKAPPAELRSRREELLRWDAETNAAYDD